VTVTVETVARVEGRRTRRRGRERKSMVVVGRRVGGGGTMIRMWVCN